MRNYIVYKITNLSNKKVYIGQTIRTLEYRLERHLRESENDPHTTNKFHRAIRKYGRKNFIIEEIDTATNQKELNKKEIYWIEKYNSIKNGYNTAAGGEGGNTYKGRTPEEMKLTKEKISKANLGRKNGMSNQIKAKNVKTGKEYFFDTLGACLTFLGICNKYCVMARVKKECNTLWRNEWMFAYENEDYQDFHEYHYDPSCRAGKPVILKKDGQIFKFNSKSKALKFLNCEKIQLIDKMVVNGYSVEIP